MSPGVKSDGNATSAKANCGGGGGGGGRNNTAETRKGGAGGSGIVVFRYTMQKSGFRVIVR